MQIKKKPYLNNLITALITPFNINHSINYKNLFKLINYQLSNNITDYVFFGTTGENFSLNELEKDFFLDKVLSIYSEKINYVIGVFENDYRKCIKLINHYNKFFNSEYFLLSCPFYTSSDQKGLYEYYLNISRESNSKIILYNNPSRSFSNLDSSTLEKIFKSCSNIIGIKNSIKDTNKILKTIKIASEFNRIFFCGDDFNFLFMLKNKFNGIISCYSNVLPMLYYKIFCFYKNNKAIELESSINLLIDFFYILKSNKNPINTKYLLSFLTNIKCYFRIPLSNNDLKYLLNLKKKIRFFNLL